jgi:hypothetical protein
MSVFAKVEKSTSATKVQSTLIDDGVATIAGTSGTMRNLVLRKIKTTAKCGNEIKTKDKTGPVSGFLL